MSINPTLEVVQFMLQTVDQVSVILSSISYIAHSHLCFCYCAVITCTEPPRLSEVNRPSRRITRTGPLWHWGGLNTVPLWGLLRMCANRLRPDRDRTRGCRTLVRKRLASHYLCCHPVWAGRDSMRTSDRHTALFFLTTSLFQTAAQVSYFSKPHCSSFTVQSCVGQF